MAKNKSIKQYNEAVEKLFENIHLDEIELKQLRIEIDLAFKIDVDTEEIYKKVSPYIKGRMSNYFSTISRKVFDDMIAHKKKIDSIPSEYNIDDLPSLYKTDLDQMIDIFVMGYKSTALLVLGRIFEKIFITWAYELIKQDKNKLSISKKEFKELTFENILELFKEKNLITSKDWHILSKIRLDRNVGGHYLSEKDALMRSETDQQAEMSLKLALPLIKKYDEKINSLHS